MAVSKAPRAKPTICAHNHHGVAQAPAQRTRRKCRWLAGPPCVVRKAPCLSDTQKRVVTSWASPRGPDGFDGLDHSQSGFWAGWYLDGLPSRRAHVGFDGWRTGGDGRMARRIPLSSLSLNGGRMAGRRRTRREESRAATWEKRNAAAHTTCLPWKVDTGTEASSRRCEGGLDTRAE